jgi:hypothetical protein
MVLLLVQGGILAVLAFYGLVVRAMVQDPCSRPFLLGILLCSLTLNVTELFPVDLLLATAPCRSLQTTTDRAGANPLAAGLSRRGNGPFSRWLRPPPTPQPALRAPAPSQS